MNFTDVAPPVNRGGRQHGQCTTLQGKRKAEASQKAFAKASTPKGTTKTPVAKSSPCVSKQAIAAPPVAHVFAEISPTQAFHLPGQDDDVMGSGADLPAAWEQAHLEAWVNAENATADS